MRVTWTPAKRELTVADRGVDFESAREVFAGVTADFEDTRRDYGETRMVTVGHLEGRMMIVVWTPRGDARHVISMRKANGREQRRFAHRFEDA